MESFDPQDSRHINWHLRTRTLRGSSRARIGSSRISIRVSFPIKSIFLMRRFEHDSRKICKQKVKCTPCSTEFRFRSRMILTVSSNVFILDILQRVTSDNRCETTAKQVWIHKAQNRDQSQIPRQMLAYCEDMNLDELSIEGERCIQAVRV